MKRMMKWMGMALAILSFAFVLGGCADSGSDQHKSGGTPVIDKSGPEYTAAWICPMYCPGSGSEEPGLCPVCNMKYVKNPDAPKHAPSDKVLPNGADSSAQHTTPDEVHS